MIDWNTLFFISPREFAVLADKCRINIQDTLAFDNEAQLMIERILGPLPVKDDPSV